MQELQLRDAKATAVVDSARRGEPSVITRHGRREAVMLGYQASKTRSSVPSFARLLMACPLEAGDLPARGAAPREIDV
jgi:prevent-host-death family protein